MLLDRNMKHDEMSCIEPGLVTRFVHDVLHVSMPFSQVFPPSPSPTESRRLFYTSVSLLLSHIQGYCCHLSGFHVYALVYCIGVFLFFFFQFYFIFKLYITVLDLPNIKMNPPQVYMCSPS